MMNEEMIINIFAELKQYDKDDRVEASIVCDLLGADKKVISEYNNNYLPLYELVNNLETKQFMDHNVFDIESYDNYRVDVMRNFNKRMAIEYPVEAKEIINRELNNEVKFERKLTIF